MTNNIISIEINNTTVILEGSRENLFVSPFIRVINPDSETLIIDEKITGSKTFLNTIRNFRNAIISAIGIFSKKGSLTLEVEKDLRKLINQNHYKAIIENMIAAYKIKFIKSYDKLENITIYNKGITIVVPNTQGMKIKLNFVYPRRWSYCLYLIIIKDNLSFEIVRWRKLFNANSIIKQIIDWEEDAPTHKNPDLFFTAKMDLKGYVISNKSEINALLLDLNDYTKKVER